MIERACAGASSKLNLPWSSVVPEAVNDPLRKWTAAPAMGAPVWSLTAPAIRGSWGDAALRLAA